MIPTVEKGEWQANLEAMMPIPPTRRVEITSRQRRDPPGGHMPVHENLHLEAFVWVGFGCSPPPDDALIDAIDVTFDFEQIRIAALPAYGGQEFLQGMVSIR